MRTNRLTLLTVLTLLLAASAVRAGLSFTLMPAARSAAKGNQLFFIGTLSNTSLTDDLFLNDIRFSFSGAATNYLVADANAFFANVPGILTPGQTYGDVIFGVVINAATPPGDYLGSVTIQGGSNIFSVADLTNQTFEVSVVVYDVPFSAWQTAQFGADATNTAISGDFADPDRDGVANLLEYALYLSPTVANAAGLPTVQIEPSCGCLTLTYVKVISATDLIYTAEAANDPGGMWSTSGVTEAVIGDDGVTQMIKASDTAYPIASTGRRFIHLKITRVQ